MRERRQDSGEFGNDVSLERGNSSSRVQLLVNLPVDLHSSCCYCNADAWPGEAQIPLHVCLEVKGPSEFAAN